MTERVALAIVADFDAGSRSHSATNDAIAHSAVARGVAVDLQWIGTLFLPQHRSTPSNPHPLVSAFVGACRTNR